MVDQVEPAAVRREGVDVVVAAERQRPRERELRGADDGEARPRAQHALRVHVVAEDERAAVGAEAAEPAVERDERQPEARRAASSVATVRPATASRPCSWRPSAS